MKNVEIIQQVLVNQLINPLLLFMIQFTGISSFKLVSLGNKTWHHVPVCLYY